MRNAILITVAMVFMAMGCSKKDNNLTGGGDAVYLDPSAPIEERVTDLLARMSLDEKIGQMCQAERGALASPDEIRTYYLGSLLSGGGSAPADNSPSG